MPSFERAETPLQEDVLQGSRRILTAPSYWCVIVAVAVFLAWFSLAKKLLSWGGLIGVQEMGQFGDSFGVLTSLFSGLALAGVVYTVLLQRQELKAMKEEMSRTSKAHEEMQRLGVFELHLAHMKERLGAKVAPNTSDQEGASLAWFNAYSDSQLWDLPVFYENILYGIRAVHGALNYAESSFGNQSDELIELVLRSLPWGYSKALRRFPLAEWRLHQECEGLLGRLERLDKVCQYHSDPGTFAITGRDGEDEALHVYVRRGDRNRVEWLLKFGARIGRRGHDGRTAVDIATEQRESTAGDEHHCFSDLEAYLRNQGGRPAESSQED